MPLLLTRGRLATTLLGVSTLLALSGCNPPNVMPVAPPGMEFRPVVEEREEDRAQALGEMRNTANVMPEAGTTISQIPPAEPTEVGKPRTLESGLIYETTKPGTGEVAASGRNVYVHYTGTLTNGEKFDSSRDSGRPFMFTIGAGGVIRGWDLGVCGMKTGEHRKLTIPPGLAYGNETKGPIPPGSTLLFDIELIKVE
jgi:peptidylprolyl isomerase